MYLQLCPRTLSESRLWPDIFNRIWDIVLFCKLMAATHLNSGSGPRFITLLIYHRGVWASIVIRDIVIHFPALFGTKKPVSFETGRDKKRKPKYID